MSQADPEGAVAPSIRWWERQTASFSRTLRFQHETTQRSINRAEITGHGGSGRVFDLRLVMTHVPNSPPEEDNTAKTESQETES